MTGSLQLEARHDATPLDIDAIEARLYEFNRTAIGRHDGQGLGFVLREAGGAIVGAANGYSWAGIAELKQLWVDERCRGRGHGRALLQAFIAEARRRDVRRIWVASYDFQAPALYEKAGFTRRAELAGWPDSHTNVILCLDLDAG